MVAKKIYPMAETVECANPDCGMIGERTVNNGGERRQLWYCCPACKKRRAVLARSGQITPKRNNPKNTLQELEDERNSNIDFSGLGKRKRIEAIPAPTDYERKLWGWE